jgi:hypothetical protein
MLPPDSAEMDLRGCLCDIAKWMSGRKHVERLTKAEVILSAAKDLQL